MKSFQKLIVLFLVGFALFFNAHGKTWWNKEDEEAVKKLITQYYDAFSNLEKTKNWQAVIKYFHSSYIRETSYVSLQGTVKKVTMDYFTFSDYLENITKHGSEKKAEEQIFTTFSLNQITNIQISHDIAIVSLLAKYQVKNNEEKLSEGNATNTITLRKISGEWFIISTNIVRIEDYVLKSNCICTMFTNPDVKNLRLFQVVYPKGNEYVTELVDIKNVYTDGRRTFKSRNSTYLWDKNNQFFDITDSNKPKSFGRIENEKDIFLAILQSEFSENCLKAILK